MELIHTLFDRAVETYGKKIAIEESDNQFTYAQLKHRSESIALVLLRLGIKEGDRVAILAPNCADYLSIQYATSRIGALLEVLNTRHVTSELIYAINNADARCLFIHQDCGEHLKELESLTTIEYSIGLKAFEDCQFNLDNLLQDTKEAKLPTLEKKNIPAVLMYTSGTTGRPKGAIQDQENSINADLITVSLLNIIKEDRFLAFMPFFHQAGLIRARAVLSQGAAIIIPSSINKENIAQFLINEKITMTMLVPPYNGTLLQICKEENLSLPDLRMLIGGPAGKSVKEFCHEQRCSYMTVYGQTEVTGLITAISDQEIWSHPDSVGKVVNDMEIQIWDESNKPVKIGETGEIMAKSIRCIKGYWNNQQASESLYSGEWLHTGDLGKLNDEGFLYFINRKKELIKTGGENVYPLEVENVLSQHPEVKEVVVLGLPDSEWGEAVTAVLVTLDNEEITQEDLKEFCGGKLAGYKIPKQVFCTDEIPRNHTGKVNKILLQESLIMPKEY